MKTFPLPLISTPDMVGQFSTIKQDLLQLSCTHDHETPHMS